MTSAELLARLRRYEPWSAPAGSAKPAAVLVPFREETQGELSLVLTRRSAELPIHAGQVSFPGGGIKAEDPSPEAAALREAEEEVGLPKAGVQLVGRLDDLLTFNGFLITPVVGVVDPAIRLVPRLGEVARIFSIPMTLLLDDKGWVQKEHERAGQRYTLWHFYHDGEDLWGLTGQIVRGMLEMLWRE